MCTILFSWKNHPRYRLIVSANRDEFYNRPTNPASTWEEDENLVAGRDLKDQGTWMGYTKGNRFAALTNYRNFDMLKEDAPSRGGLVKDFLLSDICPKEYIESIEEKSKEYNPYNILLGTKDELWYFNNVNFENKELIPGIYGLSNGFLDEAWPKVLTGKKEFEDRISYDPIDPKHLFEMMVNREQAPDDQLPKTGVPYGMEKGLSPLFIELANYGTRCSTVILSDDQNTTFVEKSYKLREQEEGLVEFSV